MSKINVLILEDDSLEATLLKEYLEEYNYNIVKVTSTVDEALDVYSSQTIDLIIVDIFLNEKPEGIDFIKALPKQNPNFTTPCIFLKRHTDRSIFEEAKMTNPHGYYIKPFNELELSYTIDLVLEKI